jgi:hypothetical protein
MANSFARMIRRKFENKINRVLRFLQRFVYNSQKNKVLDLYWKFRIIEIKNYDQIFEDIIVKEDYERSFF